MKYLITILIIILIFSSCKKDDSDTTIPTITINAPMNQADHSSGDMLHIDIDISDNDEIHNVNAYLITSHMGMIDTVWSEHAHPDATTYTMHGHYTIDTVMHTDFSIIVTATDHSGNENTATHAFHVMQ